MLINVNIPVIAIVCFAVALLAFLYIVFVYGRRLRIVRRHRRECNDEAEIKVEGPLPKASVIVYVNDRIDDFRDSLMQILIQDYPGEYEVIVVNDEPSNDVSMLVNSLKKDYPNLYVTFTPDTSRNVSHKKLAITLGAKAANGDVIVVTDANTYITSDRWLERIMAPFADKSTELVTGYNVPLLTEQMWRGRLVRWFDVLADDVTWLSAAISGTPYRACGNNLAYRRDRFFANKGFSRSLNKKYGDDDIFVSEIATKYNTAVELSDTAMGIWGSQRKMGKRMRRYRLRHAFTGRELPKGARIEMAVGSWMMWLVLIASLAGAFFSGLTNAVGWGIAAVLILAVNIAVIVMWRKTLISFGGPRLMMSLPWIVAWRPMRNLIVTLKSRSDKNANYTWQS